MNKVYQTRQQAVVKLQKRWRYGLLSLLCALSAWQTALLFLPNKNPADLWWSRAQQAEQAWQAGNYLAAAGLFEQAERQALAYYAAEDFQNAAAIFAEQHTGAAYFAWANAQAHSENYEGAIAAYQLAAAMAYDADKLNHNLALVKVLAKKPSQQRKQGESSHTDIGADEVRFDLEQRNSQHQVDDELAIGELGEKGEQQLWLRQLNRKPVDFLQRKFSYQLQMQTQAQNNKPGEGGQ